MEPQAGLLNNADCNYGDREGISNRAHIDRYQCSDVRLAVPNPETGLNHACVHGSVPLWVRFTRQSMNV